MCGYAKTNSHFPNPVNGSNNLYNYTYTCNMSYDPPKMAIYLYTHPGISLYIAPASESLSYGGW